MRRRRALAHAAALAAAAAWLVPAAALAQAAPQQGAPQQTATIGAIEPLGQDRYRVGKLVVDKAARRFTVPGRVLVTGKPLEYLASSPGGMKAYEAMLELDANGSEFNLACILIGLERDPAMPSVRHFSAARQLPGKTVAIRLAWQQADGKRLEVEAARALLNDDAGVDPETVRWVYTGAPAADGQPRFAPDDTGTLIGFIHDANSLIEASVGIGIGAYGSVRGHAMLPPVGTPVELIVEAGPSR